MSMRLPQVVRVASHASQWLHLDASGDTRIRLKHIPATIWQQHTRTAWDCDPRMALCLLDRYPKAEAVRQASCARGASSDAQAAAPEVIFSLKASHQLSVRCS